MNRRSPQLSAQSLGYVGTGLLIAAAIVFTVFTNPSDAAINSQLNFQGRLRNSSQAITPDGDYHMRFRITNGGDGCQDPPTDTPPCGGTVEWTETYTTGNLVRVENGYFNVQLGSLTSLASVDFNSNTLWLSVEIGGSGGSAIWDGQMEPFIRLTATPYAFNSDQLDGLDSSDFGQLDATQTWTGINTFQPAADSTTALQVLDADGGTPVLSVDTTNERIGIGTATPSTTLDVYSTTTTEQIKASRDDISLLLGVTGTEGYGRVGVFDGSSGWQDLILNEGGGNVGIGLTDPSSILQAAGDITIGDNSNSVDGNLIFERAANTNTLTLSVVDQSQDTTITVPDVNAASDTICLQSLGNCGSTDEIVTVAANDSTAVQKAAADYTADGTADETEINTALSANAGGTVILLPGTYNTTGSVSIPDNTTLRGSGADTIIQAASGASGGFDLVVNTNTTNGTNVTIEELELNGDSANTVTGDGIDFNNLGSGTGATAVKGAYIANVSIVDVDGSAIELGTSAQSTIEDVFIAGTSNHGIQLDSSEFVNIFRSRINDIGQSGVHSDGSQNLIIESSTIHTAADHGINLINGSDDVNIKNNDILEIEESGVVFSNTSDSKIVENFIKNVGIADEGDPGISIANSSKALISGNYLDQTGGNTSAASIDLTSDSDLNFITGNYFREASGGTEADYGIDIDNSGADDNTISNNTHVDATYAVAFINDLGTNTRINGQTDDSGNYEIQPAGNIELLSNTDITGNLTASGTITFSGLDCSANANGGALTASATGVISCSDDDGGAGATSLQGAYDAGNTITTTDARDIDITLADTTTDSNFTIDIATGSTGRFAVQGNGTDVLGVTSSAVTIDQALTVNATATFNEDLTVAANKSLTLTGGTTANRPASPTEGEIFYDTDTDTLLTYANGKWQADRGEYVIVAANDSTQAQKDAADYVTDGTDDEDTINTALTAASGGKVLLLAGTYQVDINTSAAGKGVEIPNDTTLAGVGPSTVIELQDIDASIDVITNSDTSAGTGVVIRDLKIDGQKDLNVGPISQIGIYFDGVGGGSGSSARQGGQVSNILIVDFNSSGLRFDSSSLSLAESNTFINNYVGISSVNNSSDNIYRDNTISGSDLAGINLSFITDNETVIGNKIQDSGDRGIQVDGNNHVVVSNTSLRDDKGIEVGYSNNIVSSNIVKSATGVGISVGGSSHTISDNNVDDSGSYGISISSSNTVVSSNTVANSDDTTDNNGVFLSSADANSILGNAVTDSSATTTNFAINISNSTSDDNYLADNTLGGGSINDVGTGTVYGGQVDSSNNYEIQPAGNIELLANTDITGTLSVSDVVTLSNYDCSGADTFLTTNGSGVLSCAAASSGVTSLNGATGALTIANASELGGTITIQDASAVQAGLVSTGTQTFAGDKTFDGSITANDGIIGVNGSEYVTLNSSARIGYIDTEVEVTNGDIIFDTLGTERARISNSGLSVGTSSSYGQLTLGNDQWISAVNNAGGSGVNLFKLNTSDEIDVGATLNIDGGLVFPEDGGLVTFSELPISTTPTAGTVQGYSFKVDNDSTLTVYGEADGSGGVQNSRIGIGTTSPADTLDVAGDIRVGTGTTGCVKDADGTVLTGTCSSDRRLKQNITGFDSVLGDYLQLNPVTYNWRASQFPERSYGTATQYGLIAQDVEAVFPELVTTDDSGYRQVDFTALNFYTMQAVREVGQQQQTLDATLSSLQTQTATQQQQIDNHANANYLQSGASANLSALNVSGSSKLNTLTVRDGAWFKDDVLIDGTLTVNDVEVTGELVLADAQLTSQGDNLEIEPLFEPADGEQQPLAAEVDGTDVAGTIRFSSDEDIDAGAIAELLFTNEYSANPRIVISPKNADSAGLLAFIEASENGRSFTLHVSNNLTSDTDYEFDYVVVGAAVTDSGAN